MKEALKKVANFFIQPNIIISCLAYMLFLIFATLAIVFSVIGCGETLLFAIYIGLGITFFYSIYIFARFDLKKLRLFFKLKKDSLTSKSKLANKLLNDTYTKTMVASSVSLFLSLCFVTYNAFAGIYYHSVWNGSISIYYAFLVGIRYIILFSELKMYRNNIPETDKNLKRAQVYKSEGILLVLLDIALIVPVTMLVFSQRNVDLPMWVAIASAAYTFYKVISCVVSFAKTRKNTLLSVKGLKNLNLTDAMVSLLALENTMILTFSDEGQNSLFVLVVISALAVMAISLTLAIVTLIKGKNQVKILKVEENKNLTEK